MYGLFTDVPGDFVKKPMKDCTGKEITQEWLYHIGVPVEQIPDLAAATAPCAVPHHDALHHRLFHAPDQGRPARCDPRRLCELRLPGPVRRHPPGTPCFTTEYSVRTAMEAVYGLLGGGPGGVPEVWGSVYDIRELLHSNRLPDGRQVPAGGLAARSSGAAEKAPAESNPGALSSKKVLRDQDVLRGPACDRWFLPFCVLKTEETTVTQNTFIPNRGLLLKDHCPS